MDHYSFFLCSFVKIITALKHHGKEIFGYYSCL